MNEKDIRRLLDASADSQLERLDVFPEIGSTNSYLLDQPGPEVERWHIAIAERQTAGRGRGDKPWHSPKGGGLWMSGAYTLASLPQNLSALTLAIGVGAARALRDLGLNDLKLKWPNDLLVGNSKLGGILLDSKSVGGSNLTVVCGLGINVDIGHAKEIHAAVLRHGDLAATDLKRSLERVPTMTELAALMTGVFAETMSDYVASGFAGFADDWSDLDWLSGRRVVVTQQQQRREGVAAGIAENGALILRCGDEEAHIVSGTVRLADNAGAVA